METGKKAERVYRWDWQQPFLAMYPLTIEQRKTLCRKKYVDGTHSSREVGMRKLTATEKEKGMKTVTSSLALLPCCGSTDFP